jgi:hypothetical protein
VDFEEVIVPQMRDAIKETLEAFWQRLSSNNESIYEGVKYKIEN